MAKGTVVEKTPQGRNYFAPLYGPRGGTPAHALDQQEFFGPLLIAMPFKDEEEAINLANGTNYGLVSGVWTENSGRQLVVVRRLKFVQFYY